MATWFCFPQKKNAHESKLRSKILQIESKHIVMRHPKKNGTLGHWDVVSSTALLDSFQCPQHRAAACGYGPAGKKKAGN
jgi:hypothetical protein